MKIIYCTTFSKSGYNEYASELIRTFLLYSNSNLIVVLDEEINDLSMNSRIEVISNKYHNQIQSVYSDLIETDDYRFQPNRFSYKTSSIKIAYDYAKDNGYDFLVWIDADSLIKKSDFDDVIRSILPEKAHIAAFFDRDSSYGYSETGIVCFNINHVETVKFINEWNDIMVSGRILDYSEWHDAFLFSHLVRQKQNNLFRFLCRDLKLTTSHPIFEYPKTRNVIEHLKGPIRKKLGFNPERYFISMRICNLYAKLIKIFRNNK